MNTSPILASHTFRYDKRPWTLNAERGMHFRTHGDLTSEWRQAFAWLARVQKTPHLTAVVVVVRQFCKDGRSMPDPGSCVGAAKAALDGLVDYGVLPDDNGEYVHQITFEAPVITGRDGLELELFEVSA